MVELVECQIVESMNSGMVELATDGVVKSSNGEIVESVELSNRRMWNGGIGRDVESSTSPSPLPRPHPLVAGGASIFALSVLNRFLVMYSNHPCVPPIVDRLPPPWLLASVGKKILAIGLDIL